MSNARPFWMVCRSPRHSGSETKPQKRYATAAEAEAVAKQLATQHHAPFTVLEAVSTIYPDDGPQDLFGGT